MTDIRDTLILIQIRAFIAGQRAGVSATGEDDYKNGYDDAINSIHEYLENLQKMAYDPSDAPWKNTYKEPTK